MEEDLNRRTKSGYKIERGIDEDFDQSMESEDKIKKGESMKT